MTLARGLPPEVLDELFPFHLVFGADGAISRVGPALRRIQPELSEGVPMGRVLRLLRPSLQLTTEILRERIRTLVVLETAVGGLRLRGQVVLMEDGATLLFVGTPWITDLRELRSHGITLDDLPPHSSQAETLFLLRTNQVAAEDARSLARQLEGRQGELDGANRRLRAVLETAAEGIVTMGADGTVLSFNAAAERIFGWTAEEVVGRNVSMLMPRDIGDAHAAYVARYLRTGEGTVVGGAREVAGLHRDGRTLALELSVSDASIGGERLFTGIIRDLLERKRFERDQAAQVAVAAALLGAGSVPELWARVAEPLARSFGFDLALLWLQPEGGEGLECQLSWSSDPERFRAVADAVRGLTLTPGQGPVGRVRRAAEGARVTDLAREPTPYHPAAALCGLRSAVAFPVFGQKTIHGAVELMRVGPLGPDATMLATLESIGRHMGLAVERARALRLAEESARAKEEFLAHMSHEIRTPLSAVIGLAYLLEGSSLGSREHAIVSRLRYSAGVLRGLINDVLDFAKLTAGQLELIEQPCALPELLSEMVSSQEALAQEKGIGLSLDVDSALPAGVVADAVRLNQVLLNLVNNAIKFTERGGVTVRAAPLGLEGGVARIRFSVSDTGVGIAEADRDRIFEAFTQAHAPGSTLQGGTGLGLAIVRRLVAMMGGNIALESAPGVGTTFHVTLPFRIAGPGQASTKDVEVKTDLGGLRVLVVDDSEMNRFVAAKILGEAGADVVMADDGAQSVSLAREGRFDLVLMDLQMPKMDGYEAARAILEAMGTAAPPVAALTARATTDERRRVAEAGMVEMFPKPFRPETLIGGVARLAHSRSAAPAPEEPPDRAAPVPTIDRAMLMAQTLGDPSFAREAVAMFQREATDLLDRMDEALARGGTAGIERAAHTLKSQAGTIGAVSLQGAMDELEATLRESPTGTTSSLVAKAASAVALGRAVVAEASRVESELAGRTE